MVTCLSPPWSESEYTSTFKEHDVVFQILSPLLTILLVKRYRLLGLGLVRVRIRVILLIIKRYRLLGLGLGLGLGLSFSLSDLAYEGQQPSTTDNNRQQLAMTILAYIWSRILANSNPNSNPNSDFKPNPNPNPN